MTPERMSWHDDERLYQPRIHSRRIRQLHQISEETGEPMTVLVDQAIGEFVERYRLRQMEVTGDETICPEHDRWAHLRGVSLCQPRLLGEQGDDRTR